MVIAIGKLVTLNTGCYDGLGILFKGWPVIPSPECLVHEVSGSCVVFTNSTTEGSQDSVALLLCVPSDRVFHPIVHIRKPCGGVVGRRISPGAKSM